MFGLYKNAKEASDERRVQEMALAQSSAVATLERPAPIQVSFEPLPDLGEYEEVAKVLASTRLRLKRDALRPPAVK